MTNSITCENGGTCVPTTGKCECPPNFTGDQCENQIHTCSDITCYNGGTCIAQNATCTCLPGTTGDRCQNLGQPCKLLLPNGTYTDYCLNGGKCTDLPNGAACDCDGTEYSGRRCETKATFNFNLVFNGLPYDPDIVSIGFSNATIREFTLCSFVQYNNPATSGTPSTTTTTTTLPPYLSMRGYGSSSQQIIFDNNGFFICDPGRECSRAESSFSRVPITANTWHHFCIVSPDSETSPKYLVYLDGVKVNEQFAERFNPGENAYIYLAPSNVTFDRFVGMISMTQLYLIRLNEQQIGQLAFDCYNTISNSTSPLAHQTLIKWNGSFTRVSSYNPGVFVDPAGICKSVKCMFGRQVNTNNYNSTGTCDKDRIAPTVLRCPSTIRELTVLDFVKVEWKDEDISFFDNIGVVRIDVNYHNGQQFGVGITAVRYIAFDAAGNSAECTFDVIVAQKTCPSPNQISVENGTVTNIRPHAQYANLVSYVTCDDHLFPFNDRPKFYTCDIMGDFQYGGWSRSMYYLPACGKTIPALQSVNGTVVEISCPAGTYANKTANKCEECPVNTYRDLATPTELECTMCPEGFTTGTETGAIDKSQCYKNCKIGEYEQNGNCLDCPIGTFGAQEGLQKCTSCGFDLSTSSAGSTSDTDCTETCPPGQQMVRSVNDPRPVCLHCAMGYYKTGTRGACLQCPRGLTTVATGSMSINDCNQLNCIDQNTMRNQNATIGPNTPYSELCIACEQGQFQNTPNSDHCVPCSALNASVEVPVTCQSTCSPEIDTAGCNCQITASKYANCAQFVEPVHNSMNALKIVLPLVGGVLLVIVAVVAFCFRKQIIAWFRKSHINDNQHVAPSRWDRPSGNTTPRIGSRRRNVAVAPVAAPPTSIIPRPNLRIVTSREELDQLPPLPSSSTPSFHVDSVFRGGNGRTSSGMRHLGSDSTSAAVGNEVFFEANGAPVIVRSARQASSDDSSLDSFF
uniref:EGF-like domain-containing protein n=1 Tax=Caenorhabditis japonica TaxID=281687 RepID=A0A8R1DLV6_CAEJA